MFMNVIMLGLAKILGLTSTQEAMSSAQPKTAADFLRQRIKK
jgi:hypothetical protein